MPFDKKGNYYPELWKAHPVSPEIRRMRRERQCGQMSTITPATMESLTVIAEAMGFKEDPETKTEL